MRILLVEDDKKVASFIHKGLEEEGYAVDVAGDGETGALFARNPSSTAFGSGVAFVDLAGLSRQAGRFELADGSALFLDEVAEIPLELHAKLLRVLQDGQFERVGGTRIAVKSSPPSPR